MRKDTKRNLFIAATYGAVLLLGLMLGQHYADDNKRTGAATLLPLGLGYTGKVQHIIDLITTNYVDSVDVGQLQHQAIGEIISRLDPYSEYLYPQTVLARRQTLEGSFEGIGIEYYKLLDTIVTVGLIAGGPAEQGGLRAGDRLIAIDGDTIAGVNVSEKTIAEKIRGQIGTPIHIEVLRNGHMLSHSLTVMRGQVAVSSIDAAYALDSITAYIKVKRFGAKTAEEFSEALNELKSAGAQRLILDLRENGGGYFDAATALASQFFDHRELLVYTEGAHEPRTNYYSTTNGLFGKGQLVVLIDEQSASASEIVAGAVQDLNRGVVVGRRSFGKGLVQEQFGFGDGSALNLTVARYYTPSGRCIQKAYPKNSAVFVAMRPQETRTPADTTSAMLHQRHESLVHPSDSSGGIVPDIWAPASDQDTSKWYQRVRAANLIEEYVYGSLARTVPGYSAENFLAKYKLPAAAYERFLAYAKTRGITCSAREAQALKPYICRDMEALLGRFYFGREIFFRVQNRTDKMLATALNALAGG